MRENVDQNNSEYGHFLRSDYNLLLVLLKECLRAKVETRIVKNLNYWSRVSKGVEPLWMLKLCFFEHGFQFYCSLEFWSKSSVVRIQIYKVLLF